MAQVEVGLQAAVACAEQNALVAALVEELDDGIGGVELLDVARVADAADEGAGTGGATFEGEVVVVAGSTGGPSVVVFVVEVRLWPACCCR